MLNVLQIFSVLVILLGSAQAIGPVSDLTIGNAVISPDGFRRSAVLAGGTFPGPVIRGKKGDRFMLNVVNTLNDNTMVQSTSIHWHGVFQHGTNWADGTSFVTQCPIAPNDSFLYDFTVPDQDGTFWYHSHLSTQYCDGLRGAFIVDDPYDPQKPLYDVDDESTIITLADWYHVPAPSALIPGQIPPASVATLINGKGRYTGGPTVSLSIINVSRFKRYRLRIIAMACDPNFNFSIDNHQLLVIEADGINTKPLLVDSIRIFIGQRYSAVLFANQPVGNYWVRAEPNRGDTGFANGINSAILRYSGAPEVEPITTQKPSVRPLNETDLHPLFPVPVPGQPWVGGADVVLNLPFAVNLTTFLFTMNGVTFVPPTVPVLLQILSGAQAAQDLLPRGSVYSLPPNKVIEISLPGTPLNQGGPHPFHLHGHAFHVIRSADSTSYNFLNPVMRDTVSTGLADSNTTFRFVTDNAGPWFLHCHIDWHLQTGLAVVFAEDVGHTALLDPVPDSWKNLCPKYDSLPSSQQR